MPAIEKTPELRAAFRELLYNQLKFWDALRAAEQQLEPALSPAVVFTELTAGDTEHFAAGFAEAADALTASDEEIDAVIDHVICDEPFEEDE